MADKLWTALQTAIGSGDYEAARNAATKLVELDASDLIAQRCLLVALLHINEAASAEKLLQEHPPLADSAPLAAAYTAYRSRDYDLALARMPDSGGAHLRAQLLYATGEYAKAAALLQEQDGAEDAEETAINALAALACARLGHQAIAALEALPASLQRTSYELWHNAATGAALLARFPQALDLLLHAEQVAERVLSDDERAEECAPLRLQRAFVLQRLGRRDEAKALVEKALATPIADAQVHAAALNNAVALQPHEKLFTAEKRLAAAAAPATMAKLLPLQQEVVVTNRALLQLKMGKGDAASSAATLLQRFPHSTVALLLRASTMGAHRAREAIALLCSAAADADADGALTLRMAASQVALTSGDAAVADDVLAAVPPPHALLPAVVAARAAVLRQLRRESDAVPLLERCVAYWTDDAQAARLSAAQLRALVRGAADYVLGAGRPEAAARLYEALLALDGDSAGGGSKADVAALVLALAPVDAAVAARYAARLPSVPLDATGVEDGGRLEALPAGRAAQHHQQQKQQQSAPAKGLAEVARKRRKRKRKKRLPRAFDPNVQPDPERWLPRRERAAYKRGRKKAVPRGHQGGQIDESLSHAPADGKKEEKTPQPKQPQQQQQQKGGGSGGRKKKKKGRR